MLKKVIIALHSQGRPDCWPTHLIVLVQTVLILSLVIETINLTHTCNYIVTTAGGYAVLKGLQKGLSLPSEKMIPSFACLREYGNTSCSTTW